MDHSSNISVSLQFISFKDFEKLIKCEDNKKIIDEFSDPLPSVKFLEERNPLPVNTVINKINKQKKSV